MNEDFFSFLFSYLLGIAVCDVVFRPIPQCSRVIPFEPLSQPRYTCYTFYDTRPPHASSPVLLRRHRFPVRVGTNLPSLSIVTSAGDFSPLLFARSMRQFFSLRRRVPVLSTNGLLTGEEPSFSRFNKCPLSLRGHAPECPLCVSLGGRRVASWGPFPGGLTNNCGPTWVRCGHSAKAAAFRPYLSAGRGRERRSTWFMLSGFDSGGAAFWSVLLVHSCGFDSQKLLALWGEFIPTYSFRKLLIVINKKLSKG